MAARYLYLHVSSDLRIKRGNQISGDVTGTIRSSDHTTMICCDGLGSGIKANIAARMCYSRIKELLKRGFSLRETFEKLVRSMNVARGKSPVYTAFTLARIFNNGRATVLSYEAPPAVVAGFGRARVLEPKTKMIKQAQVGEATCFLKVGEGLLIFSDGISQAGLGFGYKNGWESQGVCKFVNQQLAVGMPKTKLPQLIGDKARELWAHARGDDASVMLGLCVRGLVVNVLTGPSSLPEKDTAVVEKFRNSHGLKIIAGASTAKMVARVTHTNLTVNQDERNLIAPPRYNLTGFDLVCEGTVTLNQVYNIFDEPIPGEHEQSAVTDLLEYLKAADRVNFTVGMAANPAAGGITYRQRGLFDRREIVEKLAEKLKQAGKLVVIKHV